MGVLDEAIREHMELKRRRGADPSAVAREEHEILGAVGADEPRGADHHDEQHPVGLRVSDARRNHEPRQPVDLGDAGQETAELDMRAVFDEMEDTTELVCEPLDPDRLWLERDSPRSGSFA
jgi:hypothetical protein